MSTNWTVRKVITHIRSRIPFQQEWLWVVIKQKWSVFICVFTWEKDEWMGGSGEGWMRYQMDSALSSTLTPIFFHIFLKVKEWTSQDYQQKSEQI